MSIYLLAVQLIFAILWMYCLYAVTNPKNVVDFTIDRYERAMKFYGFKASIKKTRKSEDIIKKGHMAVLVILTIYILLVFLFGNAYMCRLVS